MADRTLRLSAEVHQPSLSPRAIPVSGPLAAGVGPLVDELALHIAYELSGLGGRTRSSWFLEVTAGLRRLEEFEKTLSARALQSAAAHFERAIAIDADDALGYYNRGVVAEVLGQRDVAAAMFQAALDRNDALNSARLRLALVHARRGDYDRALGLATEARKGDATVARIAEVYLTRLLRAQERVEDELKVWDSIALWAGRADESVRRAIEQRRTLLRSRLEEIQRASIGDPSHTPAEQALRRAAVYERHRMYRSAAAAYQEAIALAKADERLGVCAAAKRARALALKPLYREAVREYEVLSARHSDMAGSASPHCAKDDPAVYADYWLGRGYLELGQARRALGFFRRHVERNPDLLSGYFDLARVRFETERSVQGALSEYRRLEAAYRRTAAQGAQAQTSLYLTALENIAWIHAETGDFCAAARIMTDVARDPDARPGDRSRRLARFAQYLLIGPQNAHAAAEAAATALVLDPGEASAHNALALLSLDRGDLAGALQLLRKAWEHGDDEERAMALWIAGEIALARKDIEEAVELLTWSHELNGGDVTPLFLLAVAHRERNRLVEARAALADAVRIARTDRQRNLLNGLLQDGALRRVTLEDRRKVQCPCCACRGQI